MQRGDGLAIGVQFPADLRQLLKRRRLIFHLRKTVQKALQIEAQVLIDSVALERRFRHGAGDQAGKIESSEKLFFVRLLGKEAFKLLRTRDAAAESIDRVALCLSRVAQNEQVLPRQERNGDQLDQFFTLGNGAIYVSHDSQHFIA